ncbi:MAG: co-chaperone YbbN [Alphaproteobacteria bacterium]|nr:co-chaperone YbbN [Alphaproteobacteria bacterium]
MQEFEGSGGGGNAGAAGPNEAIIKDIDMSGFMADVIEKSAAIPVLVSFYTSWSESCKQLTPLLEKVITRAGGAIHMVRIDFDKNQQLAAQMKIQSVPTVVVFADQRPVDAFTGLKSEAEIKQFIGRFIPEIQPSPIEQLTEQAANLFENGDYSGASTLYSTILQTEAENITALAGMAQCLIKLDDLENAAAVLANIPKQHDSHPEIQAARAALDLVQQFSGLDDRATLEQAVLADENNHQARFDLALMLWSKGEREAAADHLLEIVSRDRGWNDDGARKQLVKIFDITGPQDAFTVMIRKKLSSILFS